MIYKTFDPDLLRPGNFFLVKRRTLIGRLISFGQKIRYGNSSKWNHCGVIINANGDLIEAHADGVKQRNIRVYDAWEHDVRIVNVLCSDEDRQEIVNFARSCLGDTYGFLTILSIGLILVTGFRLRFNIRGQEICSGLVARSMERGPFIFHEEPAQISPAYLASFFQVT